MKPSQSSPGQPANVMPVATPLGKPVATPSRESTMQPAPSISSRRLWQSLQDLAEIGQQPDGSICRMAFSPEDCTARDLVARWMREAGMTTRIDPAGNIIGRYPGRNPDAPALATGSHIDTVPTGGRFDGTLGVLAGIEIARTLRDFDQPFAHPFETIVFTDEENSTLGSKAMAGRVNPDAEYYRRYDGTDIATCLARVGGDWDTIGAAERSPQDLAAFVELHVEQGPVLEAAALPIGVVEGIVAQRRYVLTILGRSSHAGTTPMTMRQDALVAAAQVILAVQTLGVAHDPLVATVGSITASPNASNVIANRVDLSLDVRDMSDERVEFVVESLRDRCREIAQTTCTQITWRCTLNTPAAPASPDIQQIIAQASRNRNLGSMVLPSRAGHDAQDMAAIAPMGMVFVPSVGGISHSASEYTTPEQCAQGTNTLLETFLLLDQLPSLGSS